MDEYEARVRLLVPGITPEQRDRLAAALYYATVRDCRSAVDVVEKAGQNSVVLRLVIHADTAAAARRLTTDLVDQVLSTHGLLLQAVLSEIELRAEDWTGSGPAARTVHGVSATCHISQPR